MKIVKGNYYILKNSEDINDVIIVTDVNYGSHIRYNYYTTVYDDAAYIRSLPKEVFYKVYKTHKVLNLLYNKE